MPNIFPILVGVGGGTSTKSKLSEYISTSRVLYCGYAQSGSSQDSAVWTITKIVSNAAGYIVTSVRHENQKWTERTLL